MVEPLRQVFEALIVEEHVVFTLPDLCRACGADAAQVQALVSEGLLHPAGKTPASWRFSGPSLARARTAHRARRRRAGDGSPGRDRDLARPPGAFWDGRLMGAAKHRRGAQRLFEAHEVPANWSHPPSAACEQLNLVAPVCGQQRFASSGVSKLFDQTVFTVPSRTPCL